MKDLKNILIFFIAFCLSWTSCAQLEDARTLKYIKDLDNNNALGLEHTFSSNGDTLTLKSEVNILRITFLFHENRRSVIADVNAHEIKIPLYHFEKGRYTLAIYREDKIIGLRFDHLENIQKPEKAISDIEESILRSSLTPQELLERANQKQQENENPLIAIDEKVNKKRKRKAQNKISNKNKKSPFDIVAENEKSRISNLLNIKNSSDFK